MNPNELIPLGLGALIPILTAVVAKEKASPRVKALLSGLLSATAGVVSGLATVPPNGWSQWEYVLLNIGIAWAAAAVSWVQAWQPSGAAAAVNRKTSRFGIG